MRTFAFVLACLTIQAAPAWTQTYAEKLAARKIEMAKVAERLAAAGSDVDLRIHNSDNQDLKNEAVMGHIASGSSKEMLVSTDDTGLGLLLDSLRTMKAGGRWPHRIRKMILDSHGGPADAGPLGAWSLSFLYKAEGFDALFAPSAQIEVHACSVADTDKGLEFLKNAGRKFLSKNGGSIWAPVGSYMGMPTAVRPGSPALEGFSAKGWMKIVVDKGGAMTIHYAPVGMIEGQEAAMRLFDKAATVEEIDRKMKVFAGEWIIDTAADIRKAQAEAGEAVLRTFGVDVSLRVQGEDKVFAGMKSFLEAYDEAGKCGVDACRQAVARSFELSSKALVCVGEACKAGVQKVAETAAEVKECVGAACEEIKDCVGEACKEGAKNLRKAGEKLDGLWKKVGW